MSLRPCVIEMMNERTLRRSSATLCRTARSVYIISAAAGESGASTGRSGLVCDYSARKTATRSLSLSDA